MVVSKVALIPEIALVLISACAVCLSVLVDSQPFRSRANSLTGANRPMGPWPIRSIELSLPGSFASWPSSLPATSASGAK